MTVNDDLRSIDGELSKLRDGLDGPRLYMMHYNAVVRRYNRRGFVLPSSEPKREPRTITCDYCDKLLWTEEDRFTMIPRTCKNCGAAR